jgi:hypothetical protein
VPPEIIARSNSKLALSLRATNPSIPFGPSIPNSIEIGKRLLARNCAARRLE